MTRVVSSGMPMLASDPPSERGSSVSTGNPFRAALRAARKADSSDDREDDAAGVAQAQTAVTMPIVFATRMPANATPTDAAEPTPAPALAGAAEPSGVATSTTTSSTAQPHSDGDDSPVAAWVAAAVGRAFGSFSGAAGGTARIASASTTPAAAATATASIGLPLAMPALSPLEQAVHDLLGQLTRRGTLHEDDAEPTAGIPDIDLAALHAFGAPGTVTMRDGAAPSLQPARAATLPSPTEPPLNPSHVHLVLEDGAERVVVTVAMRGSDVHVALRANDEATAAALARNASSLDHAMRARGLALGELTTERDSREHHQSPGREPDEPQPDDAEPFELEETP